MVAMRTAARRTVENSSLIKAAHGGSLPAAKALHVGFWPFVDQFPEAIDTGSRSLPRRELVSRFGRAAFVNMLRDASAGLRDMMNEEGDHRAHWLKDAENIGLSILTMDIVEAEGVVDLVASAYTGDPVRFFATLAGTEYIAEELSDFLTSSEMFQGLFARGMWAWGSAHLVPHDNGPSHLELDLDLARACTHEPAGYIEHMVEETISLFGKAANDVEELFLAPQVAAE